MFNVEGEVKDQASSRFPLSLDIYAEKE